MSSIVLNTEVVSTMSTSAQEGQDEPDRVRGAHGRVVQEMESCHSFWLFDREHQRFVRIPKSASGRQAPPFGTWDPYERVEIRANGSFVITYGPGGTRRLRAWRHSDPCRLCEQFDTGELPTIPIPEPE